MNATTATAPIRSLTGAPVTDRAARIAEYVAELEATHVRVQAEIASGDPSHGINYDTLHGLSQGQPSRYRVYHCEGDVGRFVFRRLDVPPLWCIVKA